MNLQELHDMYKEDCTFEFEDKYHTILKKHEPKIHGAPSEHQMKSFEMDAAIFGKLYGERGADFLDMENNVPKLRETLDLFLKEVNPRHHPHFDDLKETVEIQVVDVEVEAGVTIDCTVVKPKALEGSDNAFYMYSHGGGGIFWDPTVLLPKLVDLATRWNMVIVGQNYRRAPEVKQPRGMLDTRAAFNFFHSNAEQYGFNKDRMCLGGFSGGGYEALGAAYQMAKNGETSKIRLLMLEMSMMTGQTTFTPEADKNNFEKEAAGTFIPGWKHHCTNFVEQIGARDLDAFPGLMDVEVAKTLPPTCVITCEFDIVRRDSYTVAKTCREAGVLVGFCDFPGQSHAWLDDTTQELARDCLKQQGETIQFHTKKL